MKGCLKRAVLFSFLPINFNELCAILLVFSDE